MFWLVFATHVVAKWHFFWLLGLTWDPSVADLGQPRTQFFKLLGRLGQIWGHQDVIFGASGSRRDEFRALKVLIFSTLGVVWA